MRLLSNVMLTIRNIIYRVNYNLESYTQDTSKLAF